MLMVEVVYVSTTKQFLFSVKLNNPCTVGQAIEKSGILQHCPEIDLLQNKVGIFSKIVVLNDTVNDKDRIEIYRPLMISPMQARRLRVKNKSKN
ncbi:MAG: hypothetical protein LEGION0398_MBIBDBAK_00533 [Legionellaceae bacterium]